MEELLAPDAEDQVAIRGPRRLATRLLRLQASGAPPALRTDGAYLVTGGLGGLGLLVARWLVERGAHRLVLMARTPLPPRAAWSRAHGAQTGTIAAVRQLESLGASVEIAPVDVGDAAQLTAWLSRYREEAWPPLRGVVHAAGVMQHQALRELDEAGLDAALRAKVQGAVLLDRLLADEPLDFFVLFSSASALLSSPRLGAYAAGNAFLDALAHARRATGRPALSVNWGMWGEVGMVTRYDAGDVATLALRGMGSISPEQGLEALGRLLAADVAQAGVLPVDWVQWQERYPALADAPFLREVTRARAAQAADEAVDVRSVILAAAPGEREALVEAEVAAQVSRVMQVPAAALDRAQPLKEMGLDSLMADEIRNRLDATHGVGLSLVSILEGPSVAQLATVVLGRLADAGVPAAGTPIARDSSQQRAQKLLQKIDDLPEAELDRLLGEMAGEQDEE